MLPSENFQLSAFVRTSPYMGCTYSRNLVRHVPYTYGMASRRFEMRIDENLWSRLEGARGDVPAARFVTRALEAALGVSNPSRPPVIGSLGVESGTNLDRVAA